ncbi:hypothetical protein CYV15_09080 [Riemerella anatipestifer]|uniref:DUF4136 domain-containing protein n=1 Tax=Riemerella anatipestifer TaxID=34085 RepID=A0AAP6LKB7_RIEAN|nr:hypothetical protein [Riemerella anatipestifer]MBT0549002.1 hypothetical protein [Riemerella anatipestifer]MBT0555316.1 hypothetical protein [Riemerella anatipestifer]MBT0559765.1 hypothetical protein [Riemerella anatipestifer]MCD5968615.1 hypothetical protein [Riemerella anatipestifer]MCO7354656.1 hypothetical protein [Riemerella anatipestifer]
MSKLAKILKGLLALLVLNSCASMMLNDKSIQPSEINNLGSFETISMIRLIKKGNQSEPSDSLSNMSSKIMDSIVWSSSSPKITTKFNLTDEKLKKRVEEDILKTMLHIRDTRKLDHIKTTSVMDSIVKAQNQRFALCVVNTGFDRRKGNYGNQIAKGVGIGILTMGMYTPVPIKANTAVYAMIFDAEKSTVVFYNTIPFVEKSPTDKKNLGQLYSKLFEGFFYKKE